MATVLLLVIYLTFISLGLPDGVFGGAWPAIRESLHVPIELGGYISLAITSATIASSLLTSWLVRKLGIGALMIGSTALTAGALLGFMHAPSLAWLVACALPLGFGAGAIDAALNHFVATHYSARHMNWLHACWGIGATLGPSILAVAIAQQQWQQGYLHIASIQLGIVALLLLALPLWSRVRAHVEAQASQARVTFRSLLALRPMQLTFAAFYLYTGIEVAVGLWLASYLVGTQHFSLELAAGHAAMYYAAIAAGRVIVGALSKHRTEMQLVMSGLCVGLAGAVLVGLDSTQVVTTVGVGLIGVGFAPIYPSLIHITPRRFGPTRAAKAMSLQMVAGYLGASTIPPLIGFAAGWMGIVVFAIIVPIVVALLVATTWLLGPLRKSP